MGALSFYMCTFSSLEEEKCYYIKCYQLLDNIVVSRSSASFTINANNSRWYKTGSARRQRHDRETQREKISAHYIPPRSSHGKGNKCREISRMFSADAKRSQNRIRRSHTCGSVPGLYTEATETMRSFIDLLIECSPCNLHR